MQSRRSLISVPTSRICLTERPLSFCVICAFENIVLTVRKVGQFSIKKDNYKKTELGINKAILNFV